MCKAQVACYELSSIDFVDAHLFPLQGGSCRCPHKSTVIQPDLFVNVLFKAFWLSVHCWGSACFQWEINSFLLYHGWVLHRELIPWTPLEMLQWCQPHILDRNVLTTITNVAWNTVINKIPSRYFTPIMSHCERTKLMICHRKAFKCHKWLGVWCLRRCPWPDMASDHWRMNWTFEKKKLVVVVMVQSARNQPWKKWYYSKKRSNTLIICNASHKMAFAYRLVWSLQ